MSFAFFLILLASAKALYFCPREWMNGGPERTPSSCEWPIPAGVTQLCNGAYEGCNLTGDLVLPAGMEELENEIFKGCTGFNGTLTLPAGLTYIGSSAFEGTGFTTLAPIPDTVWYVGMGAFKDSALTGELNLANVTHIDRYAFANTGFSGELVIPPSVTDLNLFAFKNCSGFSALTIEDRIDPNNPNNPNFGYVGTKPFLGFGAATNFTCYNGNCDARFKSITNCDPNIECFHPPLSSDSISYTVTFCCELDDSERVSVTNALCDSVRETLIAEGRTKIIDDCAIHGPSSTFHDEVTYSLTATLQVEPDQQASTSTVIATVEFSTAVRSTFLSSAAVTAANNGTQLVAASMEKNSSNALRASLPSLLFLFIALFSHV